MFTGVGQENQLSASNYQTRAQAANKARSPGPERKSIELTLEPAKKTAIKQTNFEP